MEIHESFRGAACWVMVETRTAPERQSQLMSYRGRIPENTPIEIFDCKVDIPLGRTVKVMVERVTGHGLGGHISREGV